MSEQSKGLIIHVEDEMSIRHQMTEIIAKPGYKMLLSLGTVGEALRYIPDQLLELGVGLAILDNDLPDGTGLEVATKIRETISGLSIVSYTSRDITWGDFNNDGLSDFFATADGKQGLFKNNGDGTFSDVTDSAKILNSNARTAVWGDFDNDGNLDLFVVNRWNGTVNLPDILYRNNADGTFTDIAPGAGVVGPTTGSGDSAAWGDYNRDGFLDLFVTNGEEGTTIGSLVLYKNTGNTNHWLELKLRASDANYFAYGTRVSMLAGGKIQYRQLTDNVSGSGQSEQIVHFGLGDAASIDQVTIIWPNGQTQTLGTTASNQLLTLNQ